MKINLNADEDSARLLLTRIGHLVEKMSDNNLEWYSKIKQHFDIKKFLTQRQRDVLLIIESDPKGSLYFDKQGEDNEYEWEAFLGNDYDFFPGGKGIE